MSFESMLEMVRWNHGAGGTLLLISLICGWKMVSSLCKALELHMDFMPSDEWWVRQSKVRTLAYKGLGWAAIAVLTVSGSVVALS